MGRRGRIRVKGGLPFTFNAGTAAEASTAAAGAASASDIVPGSARQPAPSNLGSALLVDVHGLELRVRNVYTGMCGLLPPGLQLAFGRTPLHKVDNSA